MATMSDELRELAEYLYSAEQRRLGSDGHQLMMKAARALESEPVMDEELRKTLDALNTIDDLILQARKAQKLLIAGGWMVRHVG